MIQQLEKNNLTFPHPNNADENGIVAWGGDLNPLRLIEAYKNGIFPWYSKDQPILWWSPTPRLIMELDDFKISRSLKKSMKKFTYKFDTNFLQVIKECSKIPRKGQNDTWIQNDIIESYHTLHKMGLVHSIESYKDNVLVGGLYGLAIGKVFCGESMFAKESDASKAAYATLIKHLTYWGYSFIDCQVPTEHLKSLGAKEIRREIFLKKLTNSIHENPIHKWKIENI